MEEYRGGKKIKNQASLFSFFPYTIKDFYLFFLFFLNKIKCHWNAMEHITNQKALGAKRNSENQK